MLFFTEAKKNDRENNRKKKNISKQFKIILQNKFSKINIKYTKTLIFLKKLSVMQKINNNANKRICSAEISRQATTSITSIFLLLQRMFFSICLKKDVHNSSFVIKNIIHQSNFNDGPFNFDRSFMYAT